MPHIGDSPKAFHQWQKRQYCHSIAASLGSIEERVPWFALKARIATRHLHGSTIVRAHWLDHVVPPSGKTVKDM